MARIKRYNPDITYGLSDKEVFERLEKGLVNIDKTNKSKSIKDIFRTNLLTLFNLLNFSLGLALFLVKSYKNMLFLGVIICNIIIGIVQEVRSKIIVDRLSLLVSSKVKVRRNGKIKELKINQIVLDDIIELSNGNEVIVDSIIVSGEVEVNEANLTGETEPILKRKGDMILSGSFVVSGTCVAKVEHVGDKNYVSEISKSVKKISKPNSLILNTFNRLLKYLSYIILPIGIILLIKQNFINPNFNENVVTTVAALVGMIPNGLILLTSTVLAVSTIRLAKHDVLVQELYCIETLARVDTLCLDKTGTITEGSMEISEVKCLNDKYDMNDILYAFSEYSTDDNATINAIKEKYNKVPKMDASKFIPFSSIRKYSGIYVDDDIYLLGASSYLLKDIPFEIKEKEKNSRVLVLVRASSIVRNKPVNSELIGYIVIKDRLRKNIKKTLEYFKKQNINIKIISGDNPITVSNIAASVDIDNYDKYIDFTDVKDKDIEKYVNEYSIFGRVKPNQKSLIIKALKRAGHTTAYVGDGVNDVLALKESDLSISIGSGSDAARNTSKLILLDDNFNKMPIIVNEGRRTINNIGRSGTLFLVKTMYSILLTILFLFISVPYPFIPIQMTLISVATIGIPSFILALEPNFDEIKDNFFADIVSKAFPVSLTIVMNIVLVLIINNIFGLSELEMSTLCVILSAYTEFNLLFKICKPYNNLRISLLISMMLFFLLQVIFMKDLYSLATINLHLLIIIVMLMLISYYIFKLFFFLTDKYVIKKL